MVIHPDQVPVTNEIFTPSPAEIAPARRVIDTFAVAGNPGVINLDSKMYDISHLKRAYRLLERAGSSYCQSFWEAPYVVLAAPWWHSLRKWHHFLHFRHIVSRGRHDWECSAQWQRGRGIKLD